MPFIMYPERIGLRKGLLRGIEAVLKIKFGSEGLNLLPEIRKLEDHELYEAILQAIESANSLDEVRKVWENRPTAEGR